MARRAKIIFVLLALAAALGLVVATNAWFVAVNTTPPGLISSALVRYLPEGGTRSVSSLLTYGSLISGSSIDPEGVPLVLPGDRLLSGTATDSKGNQTVRTSLARPFEEKETVGTVIYSEARAYTRADSSAVVLTRRQRDLMDAPAPVDQWFQDGSDTPMAVPPTLNPTEFEIVTTSSERVEQGTVDGLPATTTTTKVTTTYTPTTPAAASYVHMITTVTTVTHEGAVITPVEDAALWQTDIVPPKRTLVTETVLSVRDLTKPALEKLPTRSYLVIRNMGTGAAASDEASLPLAVGNLSTVDSNLRIGINAVLQPNAGQPVPLELKGPDAGGTYYLGQMSNMSGTNYFIELLSFRPAATPGYRWTRVADEPADSPWGLWDLTLVGGDSTTSTAVPPIPAPAAPTASPPVSPSPSPAPAAEPVRYVVADLLSVVSDPAKLPESMTDRLLFEEQFNKLYCQGSPVITVHLSYYARQSEFMDWTEFYSQSVDLDMSRYTP